MIETQSHRMICGGNPDKFCCCGGCCVESLCQECVEGGCWACGKRPCERCVDGICKGCNAANCYRCEDGICKGCDPILEYCCSNGTTGQCFDPCSQVCCDGKLYSWPEYKCCDEGGNEWPCEINKECCNGHCCNHDDCKWCDWLGGEECISICDLYPCTECDGHGNCRSRCDSYLCETCVDGSCRMCGGDPNLTCCSPDIPGLCLPKCKLKENTEMCNGGLEFCPNRCDVFCGDYNSTSWTGNSINSCEAMGCIGDCQDDVKPVCYIKRRCDQLILAKMMCYGSMCLAAPGTGLVCVTCQTGLYEPQNFPAPYNKKCGH
jgi:hypothetical protein